MIQGITFLGVKNKVASFFDQRQRSNDKDCIYVAHAIIDLLLLRFYFYHDNQVLHLNDSRVIDGNKFHVLRIFNPFNESLLIHVD